MINVWVVIGRGSRILSCHASEHGAKLACTEYGLGLRGPQGWAGVTGPFTLEGLNPLLLLALAAE